MMTLWQLLDRRRMANALGAIACGLMLAYALYAEKILGFEPCPLCMFQRVGVAALGLMFLLAALHDPSRVQARRAYGVGIVLAALFPGYVAGRHVYIQSLPEGSVPSCGASLDYLLDVFPLVEVLRKVLTGAGECQKIDWSFLGLSMPGWVLLCVIALTLFGATVNLRR
ncbi:MAG: disulfide bond formation protein B [Steroidobacteraceae bacterium]